jgi:hypothetical protein
LLFILSLVLRHQLIADQSAGDKADRTADQRANRGVPDRGADDRAGSGA